MNSFFGSELDFDGIHDDGGSPGGGSGSRFNLGKAGMTIDKILRMNNYTYSTPLKFSTDDADATDIDG